MPEYKVNLSVKEIEGLIKEIKKYREKVSKSAPNIVNKLTKEAEKKIETNLLSVTNPDGNTDASVGNYQFGNTGFAYLSGSQSAYIEFGTGVTGNNSPHPLATENGWNYASGEKIFTTKNGKTGWIYKDSLSGKWMFTEGIAAQKPVYNAAQELRNEILNVAREEMK